MEALGRASECGFARVHDDSNRRARAARPAGARARPCGGDAGTRLSCAAVEDDGRAQGRSSWRIRAREAWLSVAISAVCGVLFLVALGVCAGGAERPASVLGESFLGLTSCRATYEDLGALVPGRVWVDGEWWRIATTELLHGSWLHLVLNVWSLLNVGVWAEAAWGRLRTLGLFVVSGLGGALASMSWAEAPMVVGASAGVLGIAGGLLVGRLAGRERTQEILRPISPIMLGTSLVVLFALGFVVPVIAQAGHVGGFLTGVAVTWSAMQRGWMRWATAAVFAFAGVELVDIASRPDARAHYHMFVGFRHAERREPAEAAAAFERALEIDPDNPSLPNGTAYNLALAGLELDHADRLVDASLKAKPNDANYLDTKGWIACRRGDAMAGLVWLWRADEAYADSPNDENREHLATCIDAAVAP